MRTFSLNGGSMKKTIRLYSTLLLLAVLLSGCASSNAPGFTEAGSLLIPLTGRPEGTPSPESVPPPRPPQGIEPPQAGASIAPQSVLNLPPLKAVLIVGPIDGDTGSWTLEEIANMRLAENELKAHGVSVATFYTPNNDWDQIKAAANGAHFLLYRGHGINWGGNPVTVGGFSLNTGLYSSDQIRRDIRLASNAIVMMYGCYTSGSKGGEYNLASSEAQRRVAMYASPFMDNGAAGYYANWFGGAFQSLLQYLFQGQTLGQAYQSYFDYHAATLERYLFPNHADLAFWLDTDNWGPGIVYDYAFAGRANDTLESLFGTQMVAAPQPVSFQAAEGDAVLHQEALHVDGTTGLQFTWNAAFTSGATWASLSATSGASGASTTITLNPSGLKTGIYTTSLHLTSATPGVTNNDQLVSVTMIVVEYKYFFYMPVMAKR